MRYRISNTLDAEERLEDAAMAKAFHDVFGAEIVSEGEADFGRDKMFGGIRKQVAYWKDPAFIENAGRSFSVCTAEGARAEVERIHASGRDAFVKATDLKLFALPVPIGQSISDAIGDYIWSVIDRPPCVMVQEFCDVRWEMRFVSVGREVVTCSPIAWHITPISRLHQDYLFETPMTMSPSVQSDHSRDMSELAAKVARRCIEEDVIIDCAIIDGKPAVVEMNPLSVGNFGLYACDPFAIATALKNKSATNRESVAWSVDEGLAAF